MDNRRGFFRALGMGGAAVAAAGGAIIHNAPVGPLKANDIGQTGTVRPSDPVPIDAIATPQERLGVLATEAAAGIQRYFESFGCAEYLRDVARKVPFPPPLFVVHKYSSVAITHDIAVLPDGSLVELSRHMESTFAIPGLTLVVQDARLMRKYLQVPCICLAEAILADCEGRRLLCYANHPMVEPGLGVITARGEARHVSVRAVLSFSPGYGTHHVTIDTIYGVRA